MAKKKKSKSPAAAKTQPRLSMEALQALSSDSDDEDDGSSPLPPESEWNAQALALKAAIDSGKLDEALRLANAAGNNGEDEFEEATLDGDGESSGASVQDDSYDDKHDEEEEEVASVDEEEKVAEDQEKEEHSSESSKEEEGDDEDEDTEEEPEPEAKKQKLRDDSAASVRAKALQVVTASLMAEKKNWPWAETFHIVPQTPLPFGKGEQAVNIHDDLKREVAFYDNALEAVMEAKEKCQQAGVPFARPDDFFAEMVKTDEHMAKVKDRLIFENKKMEAVAQRKSNKEQKLRAKESHAHKLAEKAKRRKDHFKAVEDWAQSAAQNRGGRLSDRDDVDSYFNNRNNRAGGGGGGGVNKKRQHADKKYGFGGKRSRFKQTDPKALNDMSAYNRSGNFGGMGTKKTGKGGSGGANRKGKRARDASRSR